MVVSAEVSLVLVIVIVRVVAALRWAEVSVEGECSREEWETESEEESGSEATHDSESQVQSQQRSPDSDGEQEGREQGRNSSSIVEVDTGTHTDVLTADNGDDGHAGRRDVEQEEYMQDDLPEGDVEQGRLGLRLIDPVIENDATTSQDT